MAQANYPGYLGKSILSGPKLPNFYTISLTKIKSKIIIKVLDGISIDINEQIIAKDIFTGRLTEEILL